MKDSNNCNLISSEFKIIHVKKKSKCFQVIYYQSILIHFDETYCHLFSSLTIKAQKRQREENTTFRKQYFHVCEGAYTCTPMHTNPSPGIKKRNKSKNYIRHQKERSRGKSRKKWCFYFYRKLYTFFQYQWQKANKYPKLI